MLYFNISREGQQMLVPQIYYQSLTEINKKGPKFRISMNKCLDLLVLHHEGILDMILKTLKFNQCTKVLSWHHKLLKTI